MHRFTNNNVIKLISIQRLHKYIVCYVSIYYMYAIIIIWMNCTNGVWKFKNYIWLFLLAYYYVVQRSVCRLYAYRKWMQICHVFFFFSVASPLQTKKTKFDSFLASYDVNMLAIIYYHILLTTHHWLNTQKKKKRIVNKICKLMDDFLFINSYWLIFDFASVNVSIWNFMKYSYG